MNLPAFNCSLLKLRELLALERLTHVVDIGANPCEGVPSYKVLLQAGLCRVIGFEPQSEARAALDRDKTSLETYLPYAVGNGDVVEFNICAYSGWSGTLRPKASSLNIFTQFIPNSNIVGRTYFKTHRLDDIKEIDYIDLLKIDIQGGELEVFKNATQSLSKTLFIHTEVAFVDLYENQPCFGEVDVELRRQGFIPHGFAGIKKSLISPLLRRSDPWDAFCQVVDGDMIYVRDFREAENLSNEQLKQMSLIAHGCYGSLDLAYRCLRLLEERGGLETGVSQAYLDCLNEQPASPPPGV